MLISLSAQVQSRDTIKRLELLSTDLRNLSIEEVQELNEVVEVSVSDIELPDFIRAIATSHKINVSISSNLSGVLLTHNFSNVKVIDIFLLLCKEYNLTLEITGNIISFKKYYEEPKQKDLAIVYTPSTGYLSVDLQSDTLSRVFRKITEETGQNILYAQDMGDYLLSAYIENEPLETIVDKIALMNNLKVVRTDDNFLLVSKIVISQRSQDNLDKNYYEQETYSYGGGDMFFEVKDTIQKILKVDFINVPIKSIVNDISRGLNINTYIVSPLEDLAYITLRSDSIGYDELLSRIFENTPFFYNLKSGMYCIGKKEQSSLREIRSIPLKYRSIESLDRPIGASNYYGINNNMLYSSGNTYTGNMDTYGNNGYGNTMNGDIVSNSSLHSNRQHNYFDNYDTKIEALLAIFPKELLEEVEITVDVEQNSFIVSGNPQKVQRVESFIKEIDKSVPVILIEVMILEVNKTATVSTGIEWGLGDKKVSDSGALFPTTGLTLGSTTINKIIGDFNGFGIFNIGKVVPNFYARIEALETNGDIKIKSTPKLATLNGHIANLSNGERTYYAVTRRDIIGTQNPQTIEIKNYVPIDANLSIDIRPLVSGDGQITLGIKVVQSSFNSKRIEEEAPPGINSREFTSTIRVADQDIVILGGLEENLKNDSGEGVPLLSKIPILKWFFSKRKRIDSKMKLTVLIKPTIIE